MVDSSEVLPPVAGVDYPARWPEFLAWFPDDQSCREYLKRLRWPAGFACPSCSGTKVWQTAAGHLMCAGCQRKTSVTAGTIFDRTTSPLTRWFTAVWAVTNQKNGMSALSLQRALGMDYKTAWTWLHKLRRAMVRPDRDMLSGTVEVDETYVGGEEPGVHGRQTEKKCIVAIAVETPKRQFGRVRLAQVPDVGGDALGGFVRSVVATGSTIKTDAWGGYNGLAKSGFRHRITNQSASSYPAHVEMPGVHRVASLLKRWLLGTHQGAVSPQHLDYYLDEFTFRFNRRRSKARGMLFYRLLQQAARTDPAPYLSLVGGRMT